MIYLAAFDDIVLECVERGTAAPAPSQTWPLKCDDAHRQAAASAAVTSRVPLAAQTTQHRQSERLK